MALTYAQIDALVKDPTFQIRVKYAIQETAKFVIGGPAIPFTINQITNAFLAIRNPDQFVFWFAGQVALDPAVQVAVTDATVKAAIDGLWQRIWS